MIKIGFMKKPAHSEECYLFILSHNDKAATKAYTLSKKSLFFVAFYFIFNSKDLLQKGHLMNNLSIQLRKSVITAICMALCVVLPLALHLVPNGGTLFSPMHLPVLLCGLICGWQYGLLCGIFGPVLSCFITGMPGMGYLPTMIIELALYGFLSGLVFKLIHTGKKTVDIYISLISAMLIGRIITGIVRAFIFAYGSLSFQAWVTGYFISCLPGIIVQLVLLPILYHALERASLLPGQALQTAQTA